MLNKNLDELYFSQSALISYQACPLKFRKRYLEGLFWPLDWGGNEEQRENVELGRKLHLLAQRYYTLGERPKPELLTEDLAVWFNQLVEFRPYHENGLFLPEHELRVNLKKVKLVAKFDLLYITPTGKVVIFDWKTNTSRPLSNYWRKHLQTIVYRYVLIMAGGAYSPHGIFKPEELTMVYWNPRFPHDWEPLSYSAKQFIEDETYLERLIFEIKELSFDQFLPTGDQKKCTFCEYCPICHGKRALMLELEKEDMDFDLDWESIEGITY